MDAHTKNEIFKWCAENRQKQGISSFVSHLNPWIKHQCMEPTVYVAHTDYMKVATNYGNKIYKWRLWSSANMLVRHSDRPDVVNTAFTVTPDGPFQHVHSAYAVVLVGTGEVTIISTSTNLCTPAGRHSAHVHKGKPTQVARRAAKASALDAYPPYAANICVAAAAKLRWNARGRFGSWFD